MGILPLEKEDAVDITEVMQEEVDTQRSHSSPDFAGPEVLAKCPGRASVSSAVNWKTTHTPRTYGEDLF